MMANAYYAMRMELKAARAKGVAGEQQRSEARVARWQKLGSIAEDLMVGDDDGDDEPGPIPWGPPVPRKQATEAEQQVATTEGETAENEADGGHSEAAADEMPVESMVFLRLAPNWNVPRAGMALDAEDIDESVVFLSLAAGSIVRRLGGEPRIWPPSTSRGRCVVSKTARSSRRGTPLRRRRRELAGRGRPRSGTRRRTR